MVEVYNADSLEEIQAQQRLRWDELFIVRHKALSSQANSPNKFARFCIEKIEANACILELGCGIGRDARFFAREKSIKVLGLDFCNDSLQLCEKIAFQDGIDSNLKLSNQSIQNLTIDELLEYLKSFQAKSFNGLYARCSLNLSNRQLELLLENVLQVMNSGALIMLEGKALSDITMQTGLPISENLMLAADGHLRRHWAHSDYARIAEQYGLAVEHLGESIESVSENRQNMLVNCILRVVKGYNN